MDYRKVELQKLKNSFKRFAENECKGVSPLYYKLSNQIAEDEELISIAANCKQRQPMPNLFLASVQYLLMLDQSQELASFYPSITTSFKQDLPFELFKQFCLDHQQEIIELEQTKIVQTNALNRCAYLMPLLSCLFDGAQINLIDIGTSAGLTLNMDRYEYHYDNTHTFGSSPVKISSEILTGQLPKFQEPVTIANKIGIDQNPLDLHKKENADWLKALVWADRLERLEKIDQAIIIAQQEQIIFHRLSKLEEFEEVIFAQDIQIPLVIYHTHVLYQFTAEERTDFWNLIDKIGKKRDLTYLATENNKVFKTDYGINGVLVELTTFKNGIKNTRLVAETNGHANWIKWKNVDLG